ncbi:MAG: fatty acyl-AMP ligase [bacterium]|nr:fatty acyl-AMP ligase [bacterium]
MAKTLIELLESRNREEPEKIAYRLHNEPPCTFQHLWCGINRMARFLLSQGLQTQAPVIIALPNSSEFFSAFYGVQRAGGIAVPVFPGSGVQRIIRITELCSASIIIASPSFSRDKIHQLQQAAKESGLVLYFQEKRPPMDDCQECRATELPAPHSYSFPEISGDDIAFIQFTSGSVGEPKGVQLSQAGLLTNIEQMIAGMEITAGDIFVSWLPVYHDMGLILMTMVPFYLGIDLYLLPTGLNYLKNWLKAIGEHEATFTAAPDFAYRLCLAYIKNTAAEPYDLSCLRVALNAAEPVRSTTIRDFEKRFNLENVLLPAYGLAEATVGVSAWRPGQAIKTDTRGFVSVGRAFPGIDIRILPGDGIAAPGDTGEITVKSAANTSGYFGNPEATAGLFAPGGYIRTGDLGYLDDTGDLFIIGREKSMIIQGGFSISSREVEEMVDMFPFVRRSAAVGIDRGKSEGEQVYVFIEVKLNKSQLQNQAALTDLSIEIVGGFSDIFGFRPGRVYLVKPGAIPMTYNGKIKYAELRKQYHEGILREQEQIIFPEY